MQLDDRGRRVVRASIGATLFVLLPAAGVVAWRLNRPAPSVLAKAADSVEAPVSLAPALAAPPPAIPPADTDDLASPLAMLDQLMLNATDGNSEPPRKTAVPPPAGAQRIFSYGRSGTPYDIDVYAVDTMGVLDNARVHRQRLEGAGFRVSSPDVGPRRVTMVATRGALRAMVVIVGEDSGASTTSIVTTAGSVP